MSVLEITKDNYDEEITACEKKVLVDFWAPWCNPCRMLSPVVDEISDEIGDKVKICKVNIDDEPELATKFGVMSIPTLIVMDKGEILSTSVGVKPKEAILTLLD